MKTGWSIILAINLPSNSPTLEVVFPHLASSFPSQTYSYCKQLSLFSFHTALKRFSTMEVIGFTTVTLLSPVSFLCPSEVDGCFQVCKVTHGGLICREHEAFEYASATA